VRALWLTVTCFLLATVFSAPAFGAFRGNDGLLVLQPLDGPGLVLVGSHGGTARRICTESSVCGTPVAPRWSPNGREIVFDDGHSSRLEITAAQGTCLWCLSGPALPGVDGGAASFTADGGSVTFVGHPGTPSQGVWELGLGEAQPARLSSADVTDIASSSTARVAVTRAGHVWVGRIGSLTRLARGGSPSLSPSGDEVAVARAGWVYVVRVRGGASRRIARGAAPAFSPDGKSVAYIGAGHRVYVVAATGGRARAAGDVRARTVDWQPLPRNVVTSCAGANGHVVTSEGGETIRAAYSASAAHIGWNGCLTALGVPWHLYGSGLGDGYNTYLTDTALADPFAALNFHYTDKYMTESDTLNVYDLRDGKLVSTNPSPCLGQSENCEVDSVQLNTSGFTAWHASEFVSSIPLSGVSCPTDALCVAVDGLGNVLTSTDPTGGAGAWTSADVDGVNGLTGVSCPSITLCVAVDGLGNVVTSTDPTGGPGAWTVAHVGTSLTAVACASAALCVAVGRGGQAVTSTDPTGGAGAWTAADIDPGKTLTGVSCPSLELCVAVDPGGAILSSINPTGGAAAWASAQIELSPSPPAFVGVSCPSVSLCVAAGNESGGGPGGVFPGARATVSTNPTGGASAWTTVNAGPAIFSPSSVACASVSLCVIGLQDNAVISTDPAGGQAAWPQALAPTNLATVGVIAGLSCPSAALCAAVTGTGEITTTTSPSADPAWTNAQVDLPHCAADSVCNEIEQIDAEDNQGMTVLDSTRAPGSGDVLANLHLAGDELTWTDAGTPRSATLP
jgi:hypothetical protein